MYLFYCLIVWNIDDKNYAKINITIIIYIIGKILCFDETEQFWTKHVASCIFPIQLCGFGQNVSFAVKNLFTIKVCGSENLRKKVQKQSVQYKNISTAYTLFKRFKDVEK